MVMPLKILVHTYYTYDYVCLVENNSRQLFLICLNRIKVEETM